jgi:hypothetical protein
MGVGIRTYLPFITRILPIDRATSPSWVDCRIAPVACVSLSQRLRARRTRRVDNDTQSLFSTEDLSHIASTSTLLSRQYSHLQQIVVLARSTASTSLSSTIGKMDATRKNRRRELVFDPSMKISTLIAYLSTVLMPHYCRLHRRIQLVVVSAISAAPISVVDDLGKWTRRE